MTFEYECFLLHAVPYLAEPRRVAVKEWLNELGKDGWEVVWLGPQRDNEAGLAVWVKRAVDVEPYKTDLSPLVSTRV
jgi:hypothetical protein